MWVTDSHTHWVEVSRLDWYNPGEWWYLLETWCDSGDWGYTDDQDDHDDHGDLDDPDDPDEPNDHDEQDDPIDHDNSDDPIKVDETDNNGWYRWKWMTVNENGYKILVKKLSRHKS